MSETERELAKCSGFDFGVDWDHGWPMLFGTFKYEGGGQGLGYMMDVSFLMRFLDVFHVERLRQVEGKFCWVTHTNSNIHKIEPIMEGEGKTFDIDEWREWIKKQNMLSPYEMRTGKKP